MLIKYFVYLFLSICRDLAAYQQTGILSASMWVWLWFWSLLIEKWGGSPQDSAALNKEGRESLPTACGTMQFKWAQQVPEGSQCQWNQWFIHSTNTHLFSTKYVRCYTRYKGHCVREKGMSATTELTNESTFLSRLHSRRMGITSAMPQ